MQEHLRFIVGWLLAACYWLAAGWLWLLARCLLADSLAAVLAGWPAGRAARLAGWHWLSAMGA